MSTARKIAILGSTGSIGTQALEVIEEFPDRFTVTVLTAHNQYELLIKQAKKFQPQLVVIGNEDHYLKVKEALKETEVRVEAGEEPLVAAMELPETDMVLTAVVGFSGLRPTVRAIECGKDIALANKETLVVAGSLITDLIEKHGVKMIPVDSEHSALFQCMVGEDGNPLEK
ncbi:MAG: 1-deoxy-D-xylulose-5-phosphate reductoisomerase, partial [Bacteroidota bacterium]